MHILVYKSKMPRQYTRVIVSDIFFLDQTSWSKKLKRSISAKFIIVSIAGQFFQIIFFFGSKNHGKQVCVCARIQVHVYAIFKQQ